MAFLPTISGSLIVTTIGGFENIKNRSHNSFCFFSGGLKILMDRALGANIKHCRVPLIEQNKQRRAK